MIANGKKTVNKTASKKKTAKKKPLGNPAPKTATAKKKKAKKKPSPESMYQDDHEENADSNWMSTGTPLTIYMMAKWLCGMATGQQHRTY